MSGQRGGPHFASTWETRAWNDKGRVSIAAG